MAPAWWWLLSSRIGNKLCRSGGLAVGGPRSGKGAELATPAAGLRLGCVMALHALDPERVDCALGAWTEEHPTAGVPSASVRPSQSCFCVRRRKPHYEYVMSQELTFQVQEFYSKVLWCAYQPGVPEGRDGHTAPSPGGAPCLLVARLRWLRWDGGLLSQSVCT